MGTSAKTEIASNAVGDVSITRLRFITTPILSSSIIAHSKGARKVSEAEEQAWFVPFLASNPLLSQIGCFHLVAYALLMVNLIS